MAYCTFGTLSVPLLNSVGFETIEKPWGPVLGACCGHQETSCISKGIYQLEARETDARGRHWILSNPALGVYRHPEDIPEGLYARSLVLIHAANWAHELKGCIAPGVSRKFMEGEWGVTFSRQAMLELHALLDESGLKTLEIT